MGEKASVEEEKVSLKGTVIFTGLVIIFVLFAVYWKGEGPTKVGPYDINELTQILGYDLVSKEDFSFVGRKRKGFYIALTPGVDVITPNEMVETTISATQTLSSLHSVDYITVYFVIDKVFVGSGSFLARVEYSGDGKGLSGDKTGHFWRITTLKDALGEKDREVLTEHRKMVKKGGLSVNALYHYLAIKLGYDLQEVKTIVRRQSDTKASRVTYTNEGYK